MTTLGSTSLVLASTLIWLTVFFAVQPLRYCNQALDRIFGALPGWTQVRNMYTDPVTGELTHGENPLASFHTLAASWAGFPSAKRIILMGNSQTYMTSLAKGEPPATGPEKTYTDQIADQYRQTGDTVFYRLSAGALSYQEMLWYVAYLVVHPEIEPNVLLVQLNYQNFVNTGIRPGMTSLLADPTFRRNVDAIVAANHPESPEFLQAVQAHDQAQHHQTGTVASGSAGQAPSFGYRFEAAVRSQFDRVPGFAARTELKQSFLYLLVQFRLYFLRVSPSSKRSLGGPRVTASRAAVEDLAELCRRNGVRVIFFQAPANPAASLYLTAQDDRSYHEYARTLAARFGSPLLDFEHLIPARYWGMEMNSPDPLHLGREGHRLFASEMLTQLKQNGL